MCVLSDAELVLDLDVDVNVDLNESELMACSEMYTRLTFVLAFACDLVLVSSLKKSLRL